MKVFVAGATGALGRRLVPRLIRAGYQVTGMTRRKEGAAWLEAMGATPVRADALDGEAVRRAVCAARPDVLVHQLTALSGSFDARHFDRTFAATNRLRTEGTDHLLAAARAAGVRRFVAQSYAGWPYARKGAQVKTETDELEGDPPAPMRRTLAAIVHLETAVLGASWTEGLVLRYGGFYGPGTSLSLDPLGEQVTVVRKRRFPIFGGGTGTWSFVHIDDAAAATVAAVERGEPGIYNIVDDEPAPVSAWLPYLAAALGAKPPPRVPEWLGRLLGGPGLAALMTEVRGASNAKAKRELGWTPEFGTWREGFMDGLRER
jgi:nucleoside-diphosphate-sugar epimerase